MKEIITFVLFQIYNLFLFLLTFQLAYYKIILLNYYRAMHTKIKKKDTRKFRDSRRNSG
jgi:hypothetical protein